MLRRIFSCFAILCLGLVLSMFLVFSFLVLPQYHASLLNEVHSLTDMQGEALQNSILAPIEQTVAQIVSDAYPHTLTQLAARDTLSLRDAVDSIRFLDSCAALSGIFYSIDVYFERSDTFLSSCFGLLPRHDTRAAKYFPWLDAYTDDSMDAHMHVNRYEVDLIASERSLVSFSRPLLLSNEADFIPCTVNFSLERSTLSSLLSLQDDTSLFFLEDACAHRALILGNNPDTDVALYTSASNQGSLRVVRALPAVVRTQLHDLSRIFAIGLFVVFLFSCLAGYLVSWRLSVPLRTLVRQLCKRYGAAAQPHQSELAFITQAVGGLTDRADALEAALAENRLISRQTFLSALLHAEAGAPGIITRRLEQCALHFNAPCFTVASVHLGDTLADMMDARDFQLVRVSLLTRLSSASHDDFSLYTVETDETHFHLIVNHPSGDIFSSLQMIFLRCLGGDPAALRALSVGISRPVNDVSQIGSAYIQAQEALEQKYFFPEQSFFYQPERYESALPAACLEYRHLLIKALEADHIGGALEIFLQVIDAVAQTDFSIPAGIKLDALRTYLHLICAVPSGPLPGLRATPEAYSDIRALRTGVQDALCAYRDRTENLKSSRKHQLISSVIDYIDAHLSEALSLSDAADSVGLSASYLSKIFKDVVGENFNEYVNTRRMLHAQRLLLSTNDTVDEIARTLGFTSSNYFIKRFKQHYGLTPAAYRSAHTTQSM